MIEPKSMPATTHQTLSTEMTQAYLQILQKHHHICLKGWIAAHRKTLDFFNQQLNVVLNSIRELKNPEDLRPVWRLWQDYFHHIQHHLSELHYAGDVPVTEMLENWEKQFEEWLGNYPPQVDLPIEPADTQLETGDATTVLVWKNARRFRNVFRKKTAVRRVQLHDFATYYLQQTAEQFLMDEWEHFLRFAAQQLAAAHRVMQETTRLFLLLDNAQTDWQQHPAEILEKSLAAVQPYQESLATLPAELEKFVELRQSVLEKHCDETCKKFVKLLAFAGSFAHPHYHYSVRRQQKRRRSLEIHYNAHRPVWERHFIAEKEDWIGDTALKIIQMDVGNAYLLTIASLNEKVQKQVIPPLKNADVIFEKSIKRFAEMDSGDIVQLRKEMNTEHYALLRELRKTVLPETTDAFVKAQFNQVISRYIYEAQQTTTDLPKHQSIFTRRDTENIPPKSEVDDIPLQELFEHSLLTALQSKCKKCDKNIQQRFTKIVNGVTELDQVVEFNLKAALDSLQEQEESALAIQHFNDGLKRARERLHEYQNETVRLETETSRELFDISHQFISSVQELLDDEKLLELKIQLMRAKAEEKFRESRRKAWEFIKYALPRAWQRIRNFAKSIYEQYLRIGKITGLVTTSTATKEQLFRFLTETRQRITALPFIYQRLFENKPLTDERLFAGREKEMNTLKSDLQDWNSERFMSTVIIGEKGGGRTTLLNFAEKEIYKIYPIKKLVLAETVYTEAAFMPLLHQLFPDVSGETLSTFEESLIKLDKKYVCIVENIQNMFLKTVDGFDLIRRFLQLVAHTQEHVYWVLSSTLYCWEYLDKVINISQQFQRVLFLDGLKREDMESIILKRHRITGYELAFEAPESLKNNRQFRKLDSDDARHQFLKDRFFEQLQEVSQGNISVAMLYWLRAINKIEDNKLVLSASVEFDYSFIYQLSGIELFTLGALLQHETLSIAEHASVFHRSLESSDAVFNVLRRKGILIPAHGDDFQLHPFLYRPTVRALKSNNILH